MIKNKLLKANYTISFLADAEFNTLLNEVLQSINSELSKGLMVSKSDFVRVCLMRVLKEIKSGQLNSTELLYSK